MLRLALELTLEPEVAEPRRRTVAQVLAAEFSGVAFRA